MKITYLTHRADSKGQSQVRELSLKSNQCIVGRKNSDLLVQDSQCSKLHANLTFGEAGEFTLQDLSSRNGTFCGNRQVRKVTLKVGEKFRVGQTIVVILKVKVSSKESLKAKSTEPSTHSGSASLPNVVHSWPEAWECLPDEKRHNFEGYFPGK